MRNFEAENFPFLFKKLQIQNQTFSFQKISLLKI